VGTITNPGPGEIINRIVDHIISFTFLDWEEYGLQTIVMFRLRSGRLAHWLSVMTRNIYESWTVRQTYSAIVGFSQLS
jgi:hypothetical protein